MVQRFIVNNNSVLLNGGLIIYSGLGNSLSVSLDMFNLYISSSMPYVRKYKKTYNPSTDSSEWKLHDSFDFVSPDLTQYPSGVLLNGPTLYIATSNSNNNSTIYKVNADVGRQIYSSETGANVSTIHVTDRACLTQMAIDTDASYLYALNTGHLNSGHSVDRIALKPELLTTSEWINNLVFSPIQLHIYKSYMCILELGTLTSEYLIEIFKLSDGSLIQTINLNKSNYLSLGISLVNSILEVIDNNGIPIYKIDLLKIPQGGTVTLDPIINKD